MRETDYDPLTGEGYDESAAWQAWLASMARVRRERRSPNRWQLRGATPPEFYWSFWDFGPYYGTVRVRADGFHWRTANYSTGREIFSGVTASLYEAYQSVEQNRPVQRDHGGYDGEYLLRASRF